MRGQVGDRILVRATHVGERVRDGQITEVRGPEGSPPYVVAWSETGHSGLYYPDVDAVIHHRETQAETKAAPHDAADLLHGGDALTQLSSLESQEIEALAWDDVPACTGVQQKVLWKLGGFAQALLRYAPAATTPGLPHLAAHHHIWVVSGIVTIAGRRLAAGSYMHVPPGVGHAATAGDDGCTLLQMHRPHPPTEADFLARMA